MPTPPTWTVTGLLNYFQEVHAAEDRRFAFILGAGASFDSGIPMAGQLVDRWLQELHAREDHERRPLPAWATAANLDIDGFEYPRAVEFYSQVFARRFADQPDEGYAYLERILHGRDPSFGYSVLAQVLANTRHRVVITTNFDNLVADALAIYTDKLPFVCGHESLAGFVRINPRRPLVIKVHRDLLLAPKNRVEELAALPEALVQSLRDLLRSYTPIVIGYGGNDGSLMGLLRDTLQPGDIPGGIYWCYWAGGGLPGPEIQDVLRRHRGKLVPIQGFDELMLQLGERLGYQRMDQRIEQRAGERARAYRESFEQLHRRVFPRPVELAAVLEEEAIASEAGQGEDLVAFATSPAPALERLRSPERVETPPATSPTRGPSAAQPVPPATSPTRGPSAASSAAPSPATPSPPPVAPRMEPVTRSGRGLPLGPVLSARPVNRDLAPPEPIRDAPLQQSMQVLVPDAPAAHDWWTLKLNIERLRTAPQRVAAYRETVARYPDQPELLLSFGRELAMENVSGEAREVYGRLERLTPDDIQLHIDLTILHLRWGTRASVGPCLQKAWRLAVAQQADASTVAAIAFLAGVLWRLRDGDDTAALRVLHGLLPVTATPLLPLCQSLALSLRHLDHPSQQLYLRLLRWLNGNVPPPSLDVIDRWRELSPLAPEAAWPNGPVPADSSVPT
ncbi:MAG: hypothetical protein IPO88_31965 [Nannocystis sp.]|uniref:SIR2 family protein n=1 Tax=Nannocystis sp. TaxID=1962667 RepID=UPI0024254E92|nr:SIR2 family protein [Nannocystis sp.]MBK9758050.1 hypothetical protein [Nannocystis sp.]